MVIEVCDFGEDDPHLWSDPAFFDQFRAKSELAEAPAELSLTLDNLCAGADVQVAYSLFLDLNGDGTPETVVQSDQAAQPGFVLFKNFKSLGYAGGTPAQFDKRPGVGVSERYQFALETSNLGTSFKAWVRWNTEAQPDDYLAPQLPYGSHRIEWRVSDGCGHVQTCAYQVRVRDCASPEVICLEEIFLEMSATHQVCFSSSDLLKILTDNYSSPQDIRTGIRIGGYGTGFPWDSTGGNGIQHICFDCSTLGYQPVELWAIDMDGNELYCETLVLVADNIGACDQAPGSLTIQIDARRENGAGVPNFLALDVVGVSLGGNTISSALLFSAPNQQGIASYMTAYAPAYKLAPSSGDIPVNGVTPADVALISDYIAGLQLLDSPYKLIAADVDNSGGIDQDDVAALAQYLIGSLPQDAPLYAAPWHFVPANYAFPDPQSPWPFPTEAIVLPLPNAAVVSAKFIGVALGDVDYPCMGCQPLAASDPRAPAPVSLALRDAVLAAGETVELAVRPTLDCYAYGWTLNHPGLRLVSAQPEGAHAYWRADGSALSAVFHSGSWLTLRFQAERAGRLGDMLSLGEGPTPAQAYERFGAARPLRLDFLSGAPSPMLYALANPYSEYLDMRLELPEAGLALLEVFDMAGLLLWRREAYCEAGQYVWRIRTPGGGLRIARLRAAGGSASVRVGQGQ